jgi:hypothetical protein
MIGYVTICFSTLSYLVACLGVNIALCGEPALEEAMDLS